MSSHLVATDPSGNTPSLSHLSLRKDLPSRNEFVSVLLPNVLSNCISGRGNLSKRLESGCDKSPHMVVKYGYHYVKVYSTPFELVVTLPQSKMLTEFCLGDNFDFPPLLTASTGKESPFSYYSPLPMQRPWKIFKNYESWSYITVLNYSKWTLAVEASTVP